MRCSSCGVELPADAQFCIECGKPVERPASTGATTVLRAPTAFAVRCPVCGSHSPEGADYCVRCGQRLSAAPAVASRPQTTPLTRPPLNAPPPVWSQRRQRRHGRGRRHSGAPFIFMLALWLLFVTKLAALPVLLITFGLIAFMRNGLRGRIDYGITAVLWLFGFAGLLILNNPRLFVPGVIIIFALSGLLRATLGRSRWP